MSQLRKSLMQLDGIEVTAVGQIASWNPWGSNKVRLCINQLAVCPSGDTAENFLMAEEHHVNLKVSQKYQETLRLGDWIEVHGKVYQYKKSLSSGITEENYSINPDKIDLLWRKLPVEKNETAYAYASQPALLRVLRNGPILELEEHFTTNPVFDRLFDANTGLPGTPSTWVGEGENFWFYRITVQGPFVDWKKYKTNVEYRSKEFKSLKKLREYRNMLVAAGSKPSEWRFSVDPVGKERWLRIEPIEPTTGRHRDGRIILSIHNEESSQRGSMN